MIQSLCNNFIKSILNRQINNDLYVCGSYSFTPRLYQISYDLNLIKEDDGYGYCSLNPIDSSTSIWIGMFSSCYFTVFYCIKKPFKIFKIKVIHQIYQAYIQVHY